MRVSLTRPCLLAVAVLTLAPAFAFSQDLAAKSIIKGLAPRNLGPVNMGGRISSLAVYEKEPRIFYAGTASGGVWRTDNGGLTFNPVFQYESMVATGALWMDQNNPDDLWVGTGEENSRNSTSWGNGVYHTTDAGKTWQHLGLEKTRHISRIWVSPKDKNTVYVGALGNLWGPNEDRGLFKSTDGGKSWSKILYIDDKTGVIDMVVDPRKPDTMLVAMYERMRWPYKFASGGPGSGLYKTTDGGKTFKKVTKGLPTTDLGRIGLSVYRKNPNVIVASVEAKEGGHFKSTDGGESWEKLSPLNSRPFYFSNPTIDPNDENRVYSPAVNMHTSDDGGKTWRNMPISIHVDFHDMWVNPNDSNHLIVGEDGGVAQSRDKGKTWQHLNNLAIGQFYAVAYDMRKPYWIYGGLQDNGTWGGPTQSRKGAVTFADFLNINGGDGFHAAVDPENWRIVYSESQGGAVMRMDMESGARRGIRPNPPEGERYRFNWSSPIVISPHNGNTIWFGGNKLFKSVNRGDSWTVASPDLSTNDPAKQNPRAGVTPEDTGAERHCTIITISESPMKAGVVWVGTDDGQVQVTEDDGKTWTNVTANIPGVPANTWVSRVTASRHNLRRCFVTMDGHRNNDYKPYVLMTEDMGKTWTPINAGLGENDSCYVVTEGRLNNDLLFLGTELGLYTSLDRGKSWTRFHKDEGFPTVRVDDAQIHSRDLDLIVATHGRSFWIIPVSPLEQLTSANREQDVFLCKPTAVYNFGATFDGWFDGDGVFASRNTQPGGTIYYWLKTASTEKVEVEITDATGERIARMDGKGDAGLNAVQWRVGGRPLVDGDYPVTLKIGDKTFKTSIRYENTYGKD